MGSSTLLRPSLVSAAGLVGGFVVARSTGRRELGGAVFALAGAWCARQWSRSAGPAVAAGLAGLYTAAMAGSHPLAKKVGPWTSVAAVTALTAGASEVATRMRRRAG